MKKFFKNLTLTMLCLALVALTGISLTACGKDKPAGNVTEVSSVAQFEDALKKDGTIKLMGNLQLTNTGYAINKKIVLDLNGHSIVSTNSTTQAKDLFVVEGELTINDANNTGSITLDNVSNGAGYIFYVGSPLSNKETAAVKGKTVINGGKFKVVNDASVLQVTYGYAEINGGEFELSGSAEKIYNSKFLINRINPDNAAYKNKTMFPDSANFNYENDVKIVVSGGKFKAYDPSKNSSDDAVNGYLANGKVATLSEGWYVVKNAE